LPPPLNDVDGAPPMETFVSFFVAVGVIIKEHSVLVKNLDYSGQMEQPTL